MKKEKKKLSKKVVKSKKSLADQMKKMGKIVSRHGKNYDPNAEKKCTDNCVFYFDRGNLGCEWLRRNDITFKCCCHSAHKTVGVDGKKLRYNSTPDEKELKKKIAAFLPEAIKIDNKFKDAERKEILRKKIAKAREVLNSIRWLSKEEKPDKEEKLASGSKYYGLKSLM